MIWVIVFGAIGLAGAIMLISYAVWLAHKTSDLFSELDMLAVRAGELADLVSQIKVPERTYLADWRGERIVSSQIDQGYPTYDDCEVAHINFGGVRGSSRGSTTSGGTGVVPPHNNRAGKRNHDSARTRSWRP